MGSRSDSTISVQTGIPTNKLPGSYEASIRPAPTNGPPSSLLSQLETPPSRPLHYTMCTRTTAPPVFPNTELPLQIPVKSAKAHNSTPIHKQEISEVMQTDASLTGWGVVWRTLQASGQWNQKRGISPHKRTRAEGNYVRRKDVRQTRLPPANPNGQQICHSVCQQAWRHPLEDPLLNSYPAPQVLPNSEYTDHCRTPSRQGECPSGQTIGDNPAGTGATGA